MEAVNFLINIFSNQDFLFKITLIILLILYGFFALIVTIQIKNLNRIINQISFSPVFVFLALTHALAALALLFFTVIFL